MRYFQRFLCLFRDIWLVKNAWLVGLCLASAWLISACSMPASKINIDDDPRFTLNQVSGNQLRSNSSNPHSLMREMRELRRIHTQLESALSGNVAKQWGNENVSLPSAETIIKYSNNYKSRASIDFSSGKLVIESIDKDDRINALQRAIVSTLLLPQDPSKVDLYSSEDFVFDGKPFLAGLIKDNEGQDILTQWRAERYAKYLTQNAIQTRKDSKGREVAFVEMQMVGDYQSKSEQKYENIVRKYAKKYGISPALVLAIIHTESNFNPYAISSAPAYGLMQIVPSTAGADAYELINGKKGIPTKEMLFNVETNIEYGVAYLSILYTRYLGEVRDSTSQEYCVITAYNAGAGSVLRTFDEDRAQAVKRINALSPSKVYDKLRSNLPSEEGQRYLLKVTNHKKYYAHIQ